MALLAVAGHILMFLTMAALISSSHEELVQCERLVNSWANSCKEDAVKEDIVVLQDLLFFLHIPRTGGRTYFHCFLRKLYASEHECPRSYDKLRFNPSKPDCRLMVTHDDYSVMSKLPKERTSVVTILRNPVDRVLSTYEFAVEVAARFLVHPNLTSARQMSARIRPKSRGISTLDIWPWRHLVPWLMEDLFARADARRNGKLSTVKENINPYNVEEIVMPLREFIDDTISHDIVHNGATFQVAGLTNNSYSDEAHQVRHCVRKFPALGRYVLEVAKKRLDNMLYVGLTEEHKKSATMFANIIGAQVLSQSKFYGSHGEMSDTSSGNHSSPGDPDHNDTSPPENSSSTDDQDTSIVAPTSKAESADQNMTVEKLMEGYEACISLLRKSMSTRHTQSLRAIAPANFSRQARLLVPEAVLHHIRSLNALDLQLYKHAQGIFEHQHKHLQEIVDNIRVHEQKSSLGDLLRQTSTLVESYEYVVLLKYSVVAVTGMMTAALIYLAVTARRRTSKLKV